MDQTLGIDLEVICRTDTDGCRAIVRDSGTFTCPQSVDQSDCAIRAIASGTHTLYAPELSLLNLLRRLRPLVRTAASEAQIPETFLYAHLFYCAFRNQQTFAEALASGSRLDGKGFIISGPEIRCAMPDYWLQSSLIAETADPLNSAAPLSELVRERAVLQTNLRIWARVYRRILQTLRSGSHAAFGESPLLVYSMLESASERRVFEHSARGDLPFLPRAKAWLVAKHWSLFQLLTEENPATQDAYVAKLSLQNFPFPDHAAAELRLPNRQLDLMATRAVPLYGRPDLCRDGEQSFSNSRAQNETGRRLESLRNRTSFLRGRLPRGPFQVLDQSLHCGEEWSLLRTSNETLGWVKNDDVLPITRPAINISYCRDPSELRSCREEIIETIGAEQVYDLDEVRGSVFIRLVGFPESPWVDHRFFQPSCIDETLRKRLLEQNQLNASFGRRIESGNGAAEEAAPWLQSQAIRAVQLLRDEEIEPMTPALREWIDNKFSRAREQLRLSMGTDIYDPHGPLAPLFGWYHEVVRLCRPDCLITIKPELVIFFNLVEPEKLRDIQHFSEMQELYDRSQKRRLVLFRRDSKIRVYGPLHIIDQQQERLYALTLSEQIAELDKFCVPFVSASAELSQRYEELRRLLQIFNASGLTQSYRLFSSGFERIANSCVASFEAWQRYHGENPPAQPWPFFTFTTYEEPDSPFWSALARQQIERESGLRALQIIGASLETLSAAFLEDLNTVIGEVERDLDRADQWLRLRGHRIAATERADYGTCQYNPLASEERIRKVLALPCVQGVLVPNEKYLLQLFMDPREPGAFTLSEHRDRVEILLRRGCR